MTIWLNIYAIIVLLIFGGTTYILNFISPDFSDTGHPFFWLSLVITSGLLENIGVRGRIFKVPIWVIGIVLYIITSKSYYSETGSLSGFYLLLFILFIGYFLNEYVNRKRWSNAEKAVFELKTMTLTGANAEAVFKNLKNAFYIPGYLHPDNYFQNLMLARIYDIKYKKWFAKPDVNMHYLDFFDFLKKLSKDEEFKKYAVVMQSSIKNVQTQKVFSIDPSMVESVLSLMDRKEKEIKYQLEKVKNFKNNGI